MITAPPEPVLIQEFPTSMLGLNELLDFYHKSLDQKTVDFMSRDIDNISKNKSWRPVHSGCKMHRMADRES
ncbi:hypothetical protein HOY80DRAFT_1048206 [Tuber brumale]|nr:hypothetical protein HOY80DRAFT_1048206 [Tuber brumale]